MVLSDQLSHPLTPQGSFPVFTSFFLSSPPVFALLALARALKPMFKGHGPDSRRFGRPSGPLFHSIEQDEGFVDDANQQDPCLATGWPACVHAHPEMTEEERVER